MKLRLDATEEELRTRGPELIQALSKALGEHAPELAAQLSKAATVPPKEPQLKHKALRQLQTKMSSRAQRGYDRMVAEIINVVDDHVKKSESPDYTAKVVDVEQKAYDDMKAALIDQGYTAEDFEEDGPLYGASVNELRELHQTALKETEA